MMNWPDCETPDCENKVCLWGSHTHCYPCEELIAGTAEMTRRYNMTHRYRQDNYRDKPNPMTRTYAEIVN